MAEINTIDINWSQLFETIPGFKTDAQNRLRIRREIIPLIFVPGIMGSRLKIAKGEDSGDKAWDPDHGRFMLQKFGFYWIDAAERKALLVGAQFDKDYLDVDNENSKHNEKFTKQDHTREKRGWGGVFWKSYGAFLRELEGHRWPEPIGHCFEFPVHAFGYNWTASNHDAGEKLRAYIDKTIDHYRNGLKDEAGQPLRRECNKVILLTHSMGGLVARSACMLHGAKDKVLGVIHGVQPATGSPAAYWRMKAGFERPRFSVDGDNWWRFISPMKLLDAAGRKIVGNITASTLGTDGEEVTSLLANMPGGLQLLPTSTYIDNAGRCDWLTYEQPDGTLLNLPKSDPYEEIYLEERAAWRMVHPDWIDPGQQRAKIPGQKGPWQQYKANLKEARSFHDDLGSQTHDDTVQFYATGLDSPDRVTYQRRPYQPQPATMWDAPVARRFTNKGEYRAFLDGNGRLLSSSEGAAAVIALTMPDGSGDGTVPDSSGRALPLGPDRTTAIGDHNSTWHESPFDRVHEGIYRTRSARTITCRAITNLALKRIEEVTGRT